MPETFHNRYDEQDHIDGYTLACTKFFKNLQFMRYLHWTNRPGKVWTRETIFVKKKWKKMSEILRQWPLHHKTAKLLNMAPIFPILKNIAKKNIL